MMSLADQSTRRRQDQLQATNQELSQDNNQDNSQDNNQKLERLEAHLMSSAMPSPTSMSSAMTSSVSEELQELRRKPKMSDRPSNQLLERKTSTRNSTMLEMSRLTCQSCQCQSDQPCQAMLNRRSRHQSRNFTSPPLPAT